VSASSREAILNRLRQAAQPFTEVPAVTDRLPVMPVEETDPAALLDRFTAAAEGLSATVTPCADSEAAIQHILDLIGPDKAILSWDPARIPLPSLADALEKAGIAIRPADDPEVRVGVTGADAAIATTGSLVITSRPGQPRGASLLPFVHVAVITQDQIAPNLEAWAAVQRADDLADFRAASNTLIVSGASRTADIAMELVMGAHGPAELHIIVLT
jgi:L-lactate dehydrogenase complex protein LldG